MWQLIHLNGPKRHFNLVLYLLFTFFFIPVIFCRFDDIPLPEGVTYEYYKDLRWHQFDWKNRDQFQLAKDNVTPSRYFKFDFNEYFDLDDLGLSYFSACFHDITLYKTKKDAMDADYFRKALLAFVDIDNEIYPGNGPISMIWKKKYAKPLRFPFDAFLKRWFDKYLKKEFKGRNFTVQDWRNMQQEAIEGLSYRYKIHLQVKKEWLRWFVKRLVWLVHNNEHCKNIHAFKVLDKIIPDKNPGRAVITVYPVLLPGTKEDRHNILQPMVDAIIDRFKDYISLLSFDLAPRFNKKINNLVYVSGDEGYLKSLYKFFVDNGFLPRNLVYSEDFTFLKDYEFDYVQDWNCMNRNDEAYDIEDLHGMIQEFENLSLD